MKFKFSFKIHSDILSNGTRYITEMHGLVKVKAAYNTLGFLFEYEDKPIWKYAHISAIGSGWNTVSLDGDGTKIRLTVNGHYFTLVDESTAYTVTTYTGGSYKYLQLANTAPLSTANSWEIRAVYTYNGGGTYPVVFATSGNALWKTPFMHVEGGVMKVWLSSNGSTGDIATGVSIGLSPINDVTYYLKLSYDNVNGYKSFYSTQNFDNGTETVISSSTTPVHCSVPFMLLNQGYSLSTYYSNGSLAMNEFKIMTDNDVWFDGNTAIAGTDYINQNCSVSSETIYPTGKYPDIHTGTLTNYQSWLYLKDIQALKLND